MLMFACSRVGIIGSNFVYNCRQIFIFFSDIICPMSQNRIISFKESIELGKYQIDYLSQYKEWEELDRHLQYQYITQAITNKRRQLRLEWAKMANQPNFSKKPQLLAAQKKIEKALRDLDTDEETLMIEYAGC